MRALNLHWLATHLHQLPSTAAGPCPAQELHCMIAVLCKLHVCLEVTVPLAVWLQLPVLSDRAHMHICQTAVRKEE